jgi:hypothetical protein
MRICPAGGCAGDYRGASLTQRKMWAPRTHYGFLPIEFPPITACQEIAA